MKRWILSSMLIGAVAAPCLGAFQEQRPLPAEARHRLDQIIGEWESRWDWVDADGKVVYTEHGSEKGEFLIQDRVVQLTTSVDGRPAPSKALMFYSLAEETFYLVSVSPDGDLWTMSGGLEEFTITSRPKKMPNGRELMIRFTHEEVGEDQLKANMLFSYDGGDSWVLRCKQTLTRKG